MRCSRSARAIYALTFALPGASFGSVVFGQVSCPQQLSSIHNFGSAQCGDFYHRTIPSAMVTIGISDVSVRAELFQGWPQPGSYASGSLSDDVVLTITGGTGDGFFLPIIVASAGGSSGSLAGAGGSFGPVGCSTGISSSCGTFAASPIPFTFDVPQTFHLGLSASTRSGRGAGAAGVSFGGIQVVSPPGGSAYSHTLIRSSAIPEPATVLLVAIGLAFAVIRRGTI